MQDHKPHDSSRRPDDTEVPQVTEDGTPVDDFLRRTAQRRKEAKIAEPLEKFIGHAMPARAEQNKIAAQERSRKSLTEQDQRRKRVSHEPRDMTGIVVFLLACIIVLLVLILIFG